MTPRLWQLRLIHPSSGWLRLWIALETQRGSCPVSWMALYGLSLPLSTHSRGNREGTQRSPGSQICSMQLSATCDGRHYAAKYTLKMSSAIWSRNVSILVKNAWPSTTRLSFHISGFFVSVNDSNKRRFWNIHTNRNIVIGKSCFRKCDNYCPAEHRNFTLWHF